MNTVTCAGRPFYIRYYSPESPFFYSVPRQVASLSQEKRHTPLCILTNLWKHTIMLVWCQASTGKLSSLNCGIILPWSPPSKLHPALTASSFPACLQPTQCPALKSPALILRINKPCAEQCSQRRLFSAPLCFFSLPRSQSEMSSEKAFPPLRPGQIERAWAALLIRLETSWSHGDAVWLFTL